jgi:hypothetical protein
MSEKTKEEILKDAYDEVVAKHPNENWGQWEKDAVSIEIGVNAMQAFADQEKRSTAIAFLNAVTEDGCDNYFRKGDEWFLGDPEEEEDAEGPFTTEHVYDAYLQSLPK